MSAAHARGVFITFEGGEGAGKSTQTARLIAHLKRLGREVVLIHEPGSTSIGEQVRKILLDPVNADMDARAELLLYEAARAQVVSEVIRPAIEEGKVVVCDRFTDSTLAYQGYARGLDLEMIERLNQIACAGIVPDRTILIVRDTAEALICARREGADRLEAESLAFHQKVAAGFAALAAADGGARIVTIALAEDRDETEAAIFRALEDLLR